MFEAANKTNDIHIYLPHVKNNDEGQSNVRMRNGEEEGG